MQWVSSAFTLFGEGVPLRINTNNQCREMGVHKGGALFCNSDVLQVCWVNRKSAASLIQLEVGLKDQAHELGAGIEDMPDSRFTLRRRTSYLQALCGVAACAPFSEALCASVKMLPGRKADLPCVSEYVYYYYVLCFPCWF